jgi:hypothetical protein
MKATTDRPVIADAYNGQDRAMHFDLDLHPKLSCGTDALL